MIIHTGVGHNDSDSAQQCLIQKKTHFFFSCAPDGVLTSGLLNVESDAVTIEPPTSSPQKYANRIGLQLISPPCFVPPDEDDGLPEEDCDVLAVRLALPSPLPRVDGERGHV